MASGTLNFDRLDLSKNSRTSSGAESFPCLRLLDANFDQEGDRFASAVRKFHSVVASGNHDTSACLREPIALQLATLGHLPDPFHQLWWHGLATTAHGFDSFELLFCEIWVLEHIPAHGWHPHESYNPML